MSEITATTPAVASASPSAPSPSLVRRPHRLRGAGPASGSLRQAGPRVPAGASEPWREHANDLFPSHTSHRAYHAAGQQCPPLDRHVRAGSDLAIVQLPD